MVPSTEVLSKKKGPPKKKATKAYQKTIHFNVGGTKYEVSKSLIERNLSRYDVGYDDFGSLAAS